MLVHQLRRRLIIIVQELQYVLLDKCIFICGLLQLGQGSVCKGTNILVNLLQRLANR